MLRNFYLIVFILCFDPFAVCAADRELEDLQNRLEAEGERSPSGTEFVVLSKENIAAFREFLQPDLVRLVQAGKMILEVAHASSAWPVPLREESLSRDGGQMSRLEGFSVAAPYRRQVFDMLLVEGGKLRFSAKAVAERVRVPKNASGKGKAQLFREIFRYEQPQFLEQQNYLSFRFEDASEDLVWIRSAIDGKLREVGSFARFENLYRYPFALNDIDGFSANPKTGEVVSERESVMFVPQLRDPSLQQEVKADCVQMHWNHGSTLWNLQSDRYFEAPPWVPTALVYVPRRVKIVDWKPRDPLFGRGVSQLIFDVESGLLVQVTTFSPVAIPKRILLMAYAFGIVEKTAYAASLLNFSIDLETESAALISSPEVQWCNEAEAVKQLPKFDPFLAVKADKKTKPSPSAIQKGKVLR
jgi:hypothetical protein